jgi:hypothetical protein
VTDKQRDAVRLDVGFAEKVTEGMVLMLRVGAVEMDTVGAVLMLGVGTPEKDTVRGAEKLGVDASEPVAERTALRELEGAPLTESDDVVLLLAEAALEAETLPLIEREGDAEELTHSVAVRDRDIDGGAEPVTVLVPQADADTQRDCVSTGVAVGSATLAEGDADAASEGDAVLLIVGVTLVQMSIMTTEPSLPTPPPTPPPTAGIGAHPTPLAAKEEPPPPPAGTP